MAITFDPGARRIVLDSAATTASEVWSRWADWAAAGDNAKYLPALRQVGGDDLGSGLSIPPYLFLLNGWRVRPMEASHLLVITGNLFVDGGGVPVVNTLGAYNVSVQYTVPVQAQGIATSGAAGSSAAQVAAAVWAEMVEAGYSAAALLRLLAAQAAGDATGLDGASTTFKSLDGITTRIAGHVAGGVRTVTQRDGG